MRVVTVLINQVLTGLDKHRVCGLRDYHEYETINQDLRSLHYRDTNPKINLDNQLYQVLSVTTIRDKHNLGHVS